MMGFTRTAYGFVIILLAVVAIWFAASRRLLPVPLLVVGGGGLVTYLLWLCVAYPVIRYINSYIKTDDEGLEFRYWPRYWIRARWEDVDHIGEYRLGGLIPYEAVYLKSATRIGRQPMMRTRKLIGKSTDDFVLLTEYEGWPDGELARDLYAHLPQLAPAEPPPGG